jgi:hypothetical protein
MVYSLSAERRVDAVAFGRYMSPNYEAAAPASRPRERVRAGRRQGSYLPRRFRNVGATDSLDTRSARGIGYK